MLLIIEISTQNVIVATVDMKVDETTRVRMTARIAI
jgi:hypothetical protein